MPKSIEVIVNGIPQELQLDPQRTLLSVLRNDLGLTGSKYGCGEGQCGACTVLIDGKPRRSCVTPMEQLPGKRVVTIEGLARNGKLHPLQEAFLKADALQCGYCTPGMILSAVGLLASHPHPTESEIAESMQGNICRCGAYPRIVRAIREAAAAVKRGGR